MIYELKRAIFKKSNLILFIIVMLLMFLNTYYDGWKTALKATSASDIVRLEDIIYYQKYYGNVFRVWVGSYYVVQMLAPLLIAAPYLITYSQEKTNSFRYNLVSRKGNVKYIINKVLSIIISGTLVLILAELCFYFLSYMATEHDTSIEFIENIVRYDIDSFYNNPMFYFIKLYLIRIVYYVSFAMFSIGITSFFKNKIAIIISPFVVSSVLELILPTNFQPNVLMKPYLYESFNIFSFISIIAFYIISGILLVFISEKIYLRKAR